MPKVGITINDKGFQDMMKTLDAEVTKLEKKTAMEMADALLVLARLEVAVVSSRLIGSGHSFFDPVDSSGVTAFDTEYASYNHEGIRRDGTREIKVRSGGSKGKWLEDPLKLNITKWNQIAEMALNAVIG
jgi:hypothetical protein